MTMMIERITAARIADLHRQAEESGCTTKDRGGSVQVGGTFRASSLTHAAQRAIREPSYNMIKDGAYEGSQLDANHADMAFAWQARVDAALEVG
ncbi:hypothetical protein NCF86_00315 [Pelagerythrobacter marinus]|nr:hypothetical protein NCF86_00315 [Pelagerythrobacter marinus]